LCGSKDSKEGIGKKKLCSLKQASSFINLYLVATILVLVNKLVVDVCKYMAAGDFL